MDWSQTPFEPNLNFTAGLKDNLKIKYFERFGQAKQTLKSFSNSLQSICREHQKLLLENVELVITNEKLLEIIDQQGSNNHLNFLPKIQMPTSQIISSSPNCALFSQNVTNEQKYSNELVEIHTEDFESPMDTTCSKDDTTPPTSVTTTPKKKKDSPATDKQKENINGSPVISKKRKISYSSKKKNSSLSSGACITISYNESKVNSDCDNTIEKLFSGAENEKIHTQKLISQEGSSEQEKETREKETKLESSRKEQNSFSTLKEFPNNKASSFIGFSKTNFGKTEFREKRKILRQATLVVKKNIPLIDISKTGSEAAVNQNGNSFKTDNGLIKTEVKNTDNGLKKTEVKNTDNGLKKNEVKSIKFRGEKCDLKPSVQNQVKTTNNEENSNKHTKSNLSQNGSDQEVELIENSPKTNKNSKLRGKLSFKNKKSLTVETREKLCNNPPSSKNCIKNKEVKSEDFGNKRLLKSTSEINNKSNVPRNGTNDCFTSLEEKQNSRASIKMLDNVSSSDKTKKNLPTDDHLKNFNVEKRPIKDILLDSFDVVPGRQEEVQQHAYKETPVRGKNERALLAGWDCPECKKYWDNLPEGEKTEKRNLCSKHRGIFRPLPQTPESFWNPVFDDTYPSSCDDN